MAHYVRGCRGYKTEYCILYVGICCYTVMLQCYAIAQLYVAKFSNISIYLTKLYVTQSFAIASSVTYVQRNPPKLFLQCRSPPHQSMKSTKQIRRHFACSSQIFLFLAFCQDDGTVLYTSTLQHAELKLYLCTLSKRK